MMDPHDLDKLLPLKPAHYLILLALADGDAHGYAVKKSVLSRTGGRVSLGAGTLYRSLRQLEDLGLVQESKWRPASSLDDERRQYFRLTDLGRDVARAETDRLETLVKTARASGLAR